MDSNIGNFVKRSRDIMRQDEGVSGDAQRVEQLAWLLFLKVYYTREQLWMLNDSSYTSIIPKQFRWDRWAANSKDSLTGPDREQSALSSSGKFTR